MEALREIAAQIITFAVIGVWLYCLIVSPKTKYKRVFKDGWLS